MGGAERVPRTSLGNEVVAKMGGGGGSHRSDYIEQQRAVTRQLGCIPNVTGNYWTSLTGEYHELMYTLE